MAERELNRSERAAIRKLVTELCANYDSQDKICLPLNSPCYMLNKDYICRKWIGAGNKVPDKGTTIKVIYCEDKPSKARIEL